MLCRSVERGKDVENPKLFWYKLNEKMGRLGGHLLFAVCVIVSVFFSCKAALAKDQASAIILVLMTTGCGFVTGVVFVQIYLPGIAEKFAFGLIFPQRFLKEAPLVLSPIHGLISNGRYEEAEMRLLDLQAQYPGDAEITAMLVDLYADKRPSPEALAAIAECYFLQDMPRRDGNHFLILMRYADCAMASGNYQKLADLMTHELKKRNLTPPEQKAVRERLNAIEKQLQLKGGGYV